MSFLCWCESNDHTIGDNENTEDDTVDTKDFKVIFLDVTKQEFDGNDRYDKGHKHSKKKNKNFVSGKMKSKFQNF